MDLDLAILARREDLVLHRFDENVWGDELTLNLGKSTSDARGERQACTRLAVGIDGRLSGLLAACSDEVLSPYVVHRRPEKLKSKAQRLKWQRHHTQVAPDCVTRAFGASRYRAMQRHTITFDRPPPFHEIRSLGAALHREACQRRRFRRYSATATLPRPASI